MNEEALKALPRAQLQKLAKSNGVKANGKSVDIIKQLLEQFSAKQANRDDDAPDATPTSHSTIPHRKRARRFKKDAPQDSGNASDTATEPVVPDEDATPQAGPSRPTRLVIRVRRSRAIADKGKGRAEPASPRLSKRMYDGGRGSPVRQRAQAGNGPMLSDLVRRASRVSRSAPDTEGGGSARLSNLVTRASSVSQPSQDTEGGSNRSSEVLRRKARASPSDSTGAPRSMNSADFINQPTECTSSRTANPPHSSPRQLSAKPPAFKPIVVGERQGEPGYHHAPVFTRPTAEERARMGQERAGGTSRLHTLPPRSPVFRPPPVGRSQNVPRAREDPEAELSPAQEPSQADRRTAVHEPKQHGPTGHARPTLEELREALMDLDAKSAEYPQMAHEITRLQRMMGLLQSKEAWMEETLKSVQQVRITLEKHYVSKVKAKPWMLTAAMPGYQEGTRARGQGWTDEEQNPFLEEDHVPSRPSVSKGKRKATASGLEDGSPLQKRLRA